VFTGPIEGLCRAIDYQFVDSKLVETALTHRSAGSPNNERLEFVGDAILGFVIADELFRIFPKADEGQLSRLRAGLVRKETLALVGQELELGKYLVLGPGELRSGGQSRDSIIADSLEALLAAVYLDGGYESVRSIILKLFSDRMRSLSLDSHQKDAKTRLQEYLQARQHNLPIYETLEVSGEQHAQMFVVKCVVDALGLEAAGKGSSRRRAEQDAAGRLLESLQNNG
jgi:ribonuclease-3